MTGCLSLAPTSLSIGAFAAAAAQSPPPIPASLASGVTLRVGDKLRFAFYEKFDDEDEKWRGHSRTPDAGYHQFTELCGDYVVQEDGTISLPILGRFTASKRGRDQLLADLTRSFTTLVGSDGFVNVISTEHQPVFVAGSVKNPGAFKYWQGMTVLHAVALAGGTKTAETETWQRVENEREIERLQRSLDRVKHLLVRTNVLRAESGAPTVPVETVTSLVGPDAAAYTDQEQAARKLTAQSAAASSAALTTAVDDARNDVKARNDRLGLLDNMIAIRQEREKTISQLFDRDTVSRPVLVQTEGELADAQDRKRQASIEAAQAKDHLVEAQHEYAKYQTESAIELARTTESAERDTAEAVSDAKGALDLVQALAPKDDQLDDPESYEVVRKTETGSVVLDLPGTSPLEPGDLVNLKPKTDATTR